MTDVVRRSFLTTALASIGLAATARLDRPALAALFAQGAAAKANRIDVHHHFSPPAWIAEVSGRPLLNPANPKWLPEHSIEDMDRGDCAAAMISITNPGLYFGDRDVTRRLARECNEYGAKLVQAHPTRLVCLQPCPPRCRRDAGGDRVCLRHVRRRWDRSHDQLRREPLAR